MEKSTLTQIVISHFDQFQRRESSTNEQNDLDGDSPRSSAQKNFTFQLSKGGNRTDADVRAAMIRKEINHFKRIHTLDDDGDCGKNNGDGHSNKDEKGLSEMMGNLSIDKSSKRIQDEILKSVLHCVNTAFVLAAQNLKAAEESIQNILELAAVFGCTVDPKDGYVCNSILSHVAKFILAREDNIRAKACAFFGYSLSCLLSPRYLVLSFKEKSIETIFKLLHPRLLDKAQLVRLTATKACTVVASTNAVPSLSSLIPDFIITSLTQSAEHDSSFAIRVAALQSLSVDEDTLPIVLGRIRDVKEKVRIEALNVLKNNKGTDLMKDLSVDDRIEILRNGLSKRCKNTYNKTVELVCTNWLKSVKFDHIELLRLLDPSDSDNEIVCENVVRAILTVAWSEDETSHSAILRELSSPEIRAFRDNIETIVSSIKDEELDSALALFLRVKCAMIEESPHMNEIQKLQQMQKIFVDVPALCEVLLAHLDKFTAHTKKEMQSDEHMDEGESESFEENQCFICLQILKLSRFTDLQEEGSRRHFFSILRRILISLDTPEILLESCLHVMIMAHTNETDFVQDIANILLEVLDLSIPNENMSSVESKIMAASTETKMRMAHILSVVLEKVARTNTEDGNLNSFHSLIMPMVTSENITIREAGVSCLGKFALLSTEGDVVEQFQSILLKLASNPREKDPVRAQAALSMCDLALLFQPENSGKNTSSQLEEDMISIINALMDHDEDVMKIITAEICIKLMISNKFHNADVLSTLLLIHFEPNYFSNSLCNDEDYIDDVKEVGSPTRLLQMLSVFFPSYAMTNKKAREVLVDALKPLLVSASLRIKNKKSKSSVLNAKKLVGYVCSLIEMGESKQKNQSSEKENERDEVEVNNHIIRASIVIAETVLENHFSKTYTRGLCLTLGGTVGSLEDAVVDKELLVALRDTISHVQDMIDDDKLVDEFEEMHEVIGTLVGRNGKQEKKDSPKDVVDDDNLVESLNLVSLQDNPKKESDCDDTHLETDQIQLDSKSTPQIRRSSRSSRKSNGSITSGTFNCESNFDEADEELKLDIENKSFALPESNEKLIKKDEDFERRCLAPLNK